MIKVKEENPGAYSLSIGNIENFGGGLEIKVYLPFKISQRIHTRRMLRYLDDLDEYYGPPSEEAKDAAKSILDNLYARRSERVSKPF